MKIRALKAFTIRNSETGDLTSIANGAIAEVSDTLGSSLISDGLAEAYTLISPTGSVNISSNGTVDVAEYASAVVNVPGITPTGSIEITSNGTVDVTNYASAVVNVDSDDYATINFNLPALPPTKTMSPAVLSQGRSELAATTVGDYALFGGGSSSSSFSTVDAYDSNLEQQTPPAVLSQGRSELVATTVGNYALFGGGSYFSSSSLYYSSTVDAYDSNLEQQTPPAVLSQGRYRLAATTVGNYALFGGGYGSYLSYSSTVDAYDQNLQKPTPQPAGLSEGRNMLAATTVGNYALFGGGYGSSSSYSSTVDAYDSNLAQQTPPAVLSEGRSDLAATTVGDYALFGGGYGSSSYSSRVDAYDSNLNKTTPLPAALSEAKYGLAATTVGNYALFGGGYYFSSPSHYYPLTLDVYDGNLEQQTPPAVLSQGRSKLAATTVGNYALFGGGDNGPSNVVDAYIFEKYDVQLFPGTKYSFNGTAESTSSTWQTISVVGDVIGYMKIKNTIIN